MFDWVKIRPSLLTSPKLLHIARLLVADTDFRAWANEEGVAGNFYVSDGASRSVTLGALTCAWARAREYGKYHGNDLVIERVGPDFLDAASGVPSLGKAMVEVGWAVFDKASSTLTLPNFREFNAEPMTQADRAKAYRERKKESSRSVTARHESSRLESRGEEIRVLEGAPPTPSSPSVKRVPRGAQVTEDAKEARIEQAAFFGDQPTVEPPKPVASQAAAFCNDLAGCGGDEDRELTLAMQAWAGGPARMRSSWVDEAHRCAEETIGEHELAAIFRQEATKPFDERARFKPILARAKTIAGRRGFDSAGGRDNGKPRDPTKVQGEPGKWDDRP